MAKTTKSAAIRQAELAEMRRRATNYADPLMFLARVMNGDPVEVRDHGGAVLKYQQAELHERIVAAKALADKVVPNMKAVEVDDEDQKGTTFVFHSPIPLPNSSRPKLVATQQLVDDDEDATAAQELAANRR